MSSKPSNISPELVLSAYSQGIFPMACEEEDFQIYWFSPPRRCIIPIQEFHTSRTLRRKIRQQVFDISVNRAFDEVIQGCAAPREESPGCWLSEELISIYTQLHYYGFAHSIEVWKNDTLAGGLFGISLGGLFAGESMFHTVTDASKVALWATNECLKVSGYKLFDVQMWTRHLSQFGAKTISRKEYERRLEEVLRLPIEFSSPQKFVI